MDLDLEKLSISEESSEKGWIKIDMMDEKSKCSFAICSKKCVEEIGMNRNSIEKLIIINRNMTVYFHMTSKDISRNICFFDNFLTGKVQIKCEDHNSHRIIWKKEEIGGYFNVVLKYLDYILKSGAESLKELQIGEQYFNINENHLKFKNLKKLKKICLFVDFNFKSFDFEQFCGYTNVHLRCPYLSMDQLFQIKAKDVAIYGLTWTLAYINRFLKRCIDGEIDENVEYITLGFDVFIEFMVFMDLNYFARIDRGSQIEYLFEYKHQSDWYLFVAIVKSAHQNKLHIFTRATKEMPNDSEYEIFPSP